MGDKPRRRAAREAREAVLAAVAVIAGCADREPEAPVAPPRAIPSGPTALPPPPSEPASRPRLRFAGAEPRRELRYRPVVGSTYELVLHMKVDVEMMSGDHRMYGQHADSFSRIALRVAEVRDGTIKVDVFVKETREPTYEPLRPTTVKLDGLKGWFTIDDRGVLLASSPSLQTAAVREYLYLNDYLQPLPAEAVGVGAEWELEDHTPRSGISMTVTQTVRIVASEGNRVATELSDRQVAPPQIVPQFEYEPLAMFENIAVSGGGKSTVELALDRPYPVRVDGQFDFADDMLIHRPHGSPQQVRFMMNATTSAALK